jgi:proteasome accessory factor A
MIEDDELGRDLALASPVMALRRVSYDVGLSTLLQLAGGGTISALDLQWEYLTWARKYADSRGLDAVGTDVGAEVLRRWEAVLTALETDPMTLATTLDWVAKYQLLSAYRERSGLAWDAPRLAAMDLQYHDLRPERSLFARLGMQRLTTDEEVATATTEPPPTTRAWFRGKCLQRWASQIVAANWDSMVFDVGTDPLRRVPMMEPLKGTAEMVDALLEECTTPTELLQRLGG